MEKTWNYSISMKTPKEPYLNHSMFDVKCSMFDVFEGLFQNMIYGFDN